MDGQIIYVEDEFATCEQMKLQFQDYELQDRLTIMTNGQEVIDYFQKLIFDDSQ